MLVAACGVAIGVASAAAVGSRPLPPPDPSASPGAPPFAEPDGAPLPPGRSPAAAVRAADAWVRSGRSLLATDPLTAEKTVRAMTTAAHGDSLVDERLTTLRQLREALAGGTGEVILHEAVLAFKVRTADADRARVDLWNVTVLARDGIAPPQSSWAISTVDLAWEREAWRIADVRVSAGPAPILADGAVPATAAQLEEALDGFAPSGGFE